MEWFNHEPTEDGNYWLWEEGSDFVEMCHVADSVLSGRKCVWMFAEPMSKDHKNSFWYYGPIAIPSIPTV